MDTNDMTMDTKKETLIVSGVALVIVIVGAVILIPGLMTPATAQPVVVQTQPAAVAVPFETLAHGVKSTVTTRVNYVITSSDEMTKLWKMVDAAEPPPTVDFNKQTVLAVFAGKGESADITVAKVVDADARTVTVAIVPPGPTCAAKVKATAPYEVVAVPNTSLPLEHEDSTTVANCP